MATTSPLIQRIEELTKCAICLDELVDPKSLPCLHTFCLNCIRSHCRDKSPGDKSDCPVCRSSFVIPRPGVEQLKSNFFIKELVETKQASGRKSDVVQCDVCSQDAEMNPSGTPVGATLFCTCCGQKLCTHCSKSHQKIPGGAHQVEPFGNNIAEDLFNLQGSFCTVHPGNKLEIYCATCHTNVCITCHAMKHRNHECQDINDVYKEFCETLSRDVEQVASREIIIGNEMSRLDISQRLYLEEVQDIQQVIGHTACALKMRVDFLVSQLMEKLFSKHQSLKVASALKNALEFDLAASQSFTRHSRELLKIGKPCSITRAYNDLHERANEINKVELKVGSWSFPEIDVTRTDLLNEMAEIILLQSGLLHDQQNTSKLTQMRTRLSTTCNSSVIGITKKYMDNRTILEYRNTNVVLSHILPDLQAWRRAYNDVTEIRIMCTGRLSIDCDLVNSDWHGINIAIVANVIEVMCSCLFDVSGLNAPSNTVPAASATDPGGDGEPGEHGIAGESGGNVLLCCSIMRGAKLRINSLGGNGGRGQDGGDGMDGKNGVEEGETLPTDQFKQCFPSMAKLQSSKSVLRILENVDNKCGWGHYSYEEVILTSASDLRAAVEYVDKLQYNVYMDFKPARGQRVTASLYQTFNPLIVKHCYLLFKGAPGEAGQKGGRGGKGGQGGAKGIGGNVSVVTLDGKDLTLHNIEIVSKNGAVGDDGLDGTGGIRGKDGCKGKDHAYIHWFYYELPRFYLGYNLEIHVSDTSSIDSVWCPKKSKYVSIVDTGASPSTVTDCTGEKVLCRQRPVNTALKENLTFDLIFHDVRVFGSNANNAIKHANSVKFIHSLDENKPILGITTLNNQLFVRYQSKTDITVYDTYTFRFKRYLQVPGLGSVKDMTSCERNQCIYIADNVNEVVHRVDSKNKITQWSVVDEPNSLSVNSIYHVLVTCSSAGKIKEFTTDGMLIRVISLHSDVVNPSHTVELTPDQFVVSHGYSKDPGHRVCLVDSSGRVLQSYGGSRGSGIGKLSTPVRLSVSGFIFVADCANHRVLMLSPKLGFLREIVSGLRGPMRIWLDERTSRLYVADNKLENGTWVSGQVIVYCTV